MNPLYLNLGFDKIIENICCNSSKKRFFILGEYRQGKTSFLNCLTDYISNYAPSLGKVAKMNLCSTTFLSAEEYSPFVQYIADNEYLQGKRMLAYAQAVARDYGKLSKTLFRLSNVHSKYSRLYNPTEVTILEDLETIGYKCPMVFICDDVDKWDLASVGLLKKMMLDENTKWLRNSVFVFSATKSKEVYELFDLERSRELFEIHNLVNLSKTSVKNYIKANNSQINCDELYEITKGNLGETCEFIHYFNQAGNIAFYKDIQEMLRNRIFKEIDLQNECSAAANITHKQKEATSTIDMINRSSIIGERFQRSILQELTQEQDSFPRYLSYVLSSGIYGQNRTELFFTYGPIYHRLREYNENRLEYHYLFAKALQKITPSNFRLRAQEMLISKYNDWLAAVYYFDYVINYCKKYRSTSAVELQFKDLLIEYDLYDCLISLQNAYQYYYQGKFESAMSLLPNKISQMEVDFQIDFLKCLILVNSTILKSNYRDAEKILFPWVENEELRSAEPYLWIQGTILYDEIMSELEGQTKYGEKIINVFNKHTSADLEFRVEYYDYLSKNNYTYSIDNQYELTKKAVNFFENNSWVVGKTLYARAITNHVGNAIVIGEYDEAIRLSERFFQLLSEYSEIKNYLLVVANNYFVALILSDENNYCNAKYFADFYGKVLPEITDNGTASALYKINYGLMLFLANRPTEALNEYRQMYDWVREEIGIDDYYRYFIINNYLLLDGYVNGNWDKISFDELDGLVPYSSNIDFFNRHTRMLKEHKNSFKTISDLLRPMGNCILGKAWSFWGRPLLFTDIQFWSD